MNSISSPASVKSVCAASSVIDLSRSSPSRAIAQRRSTAACHRDNSRRHAPYRPDDRAHRIERRHHAELAVVVHAEVAVLWVGFLHEIMKTVKPCSIRYRTSEFCGDRSRM